MSEVISARKKWRLFLAGEDVGPMVSPLCDDWSLDVPYRWPYDEPDPFPPGDRWHVVSQQLAMAGLCGWEPTILCGVDFPPRRDDIQPETKTTQTEGGWRTETRVRTPYGDLTSVTEQKVTNHVVKAQVETEEDLRRMTWLTGVRMDYDEATAIAQGQRLLAAIGERAVMGIWFGAPAMWNVNHDNMFYHLADWPDAVAELRAASREHALKQIETLRAAGYDFLFYCVDGTEWISPRFFRDYILEDTREIFRRWRAMGGFILWHSCGHVKTWVEQGFFNALAPEVLETLSEPPVGDLPALRWARERLHPSIATKGNMALNVLLQGTEDDVRAEVRRIREETRGWRHIVGLTDDVLKGTPLANCRAFVDEARKTYRL